MARILLNEIKRRGKVVHESTLYREMIDDYIFDYSFERTPGKPQESLYGYIHRAMTNNEKINIAKTARIYNTSKRAVSATKCRVKKEKEKTQKM